MTHRPLHAVLLAASAGGGQLLRALSSALDGTGPAILPLDPGLPESRLAALLSAFAPDAIETADGITQLGGPGTGPRPAGVDPDVAVVIATSGSTGPPKGTQLSAAALLASARSSLDRIGARPGDAWLCCLPPSHVAGIQVLARSLLAGAEPVVTDGLTEASLRGSGCAFVSLVPTQLRRLVEAGADLSSLRAILLGGSAIPADLLDAARAAGGRVVTTYGMSETCGGCVYDGVPLDGVDVRVEGDGGRVSIAGPVLFSGYRVVTTYGMSETCGGCVYDGVPLDGVQVEADDGGRIRIAGPVLFSGYRLRPDLTAAAGDGRWFVTSDLGAIGPDGKLVIRGRADDVIITGGENVVADEVAGVLASCPGVREAVVVGQPDPEWGELVTAVIVPADPAHPPALGQLRAWVRAQLPAPAAPRALLLVSQIPMLPSGKPDREMLKQIAGRNGA
ncbi:MAG: AMP-binding protein [Actinomycetota bacterium]